MNTIVTLAKKYASSLPSGTKFTLKDLFSGVQWNTYSTGDKRNAGTQFLNEVNSNLVPDVKALTKLSNNSQMYIKK